MTWTDVMAGWKWVLSPLCCGARICGGTKRKQTDVSSLVIPWIPQICGHGTGSIKLCCFFMAYIWCLLYGKNPELSSPATLGRCCQDFLCIPGLPTQNLCVDPKPTGSGRMRSGGASNARDWFGVEVKPVLRQATVCLCVKLHIALRSY